MEAPGAITPLEDIASKIIAGTSIEGCGVDLSALLAHLTEAARLEGPLEIRGGSFWCGQLRELPSSLSLRFVSGTFDDALTLRGGRVGDLVFSNCQFTDRLTITDSVATGMLRLEGCAFSDSVELLGIQFRKPWQLKIDRCHFHDDFRWSGVRTSRPLPTLRLSAGTFHRNVRIEPESTQRVVMSGCELAASADVTIAGGYGVFVDLLGCVIAGRMAVETDGGTARIDLTNSTISGTIDLEQVSVDWLHLHNTSIANGALFCGHTIPLLREKVYRTKCGTHQLPSTVDDPADSKSTLQRISEEFEELAACFKRTPGSDSHEDRCDYLCRDYRRMHELLLIGPARCAVERIAILLSVSIGVAALYGWIDSGLVVMAVLPFALTCLFDWVEYRRHPLPFRVVVWSGLLKWTTGFGASFNRTLSASLAFILLYAAVYFSMSMWAADIGQLVHDGPNDTTLSIFEEAPGDDLQLSQRIGRCIYFSAVTFTTLGYGDYRPEGRLIYVVTAEALTGAVSIALITVLLARRYLRL